MFSRVLVIVAAVFSLCLAPNLSAQEKGDNKKDDKAAQAGGKQADEQAREVVQQFAKAVRARDLAGALKSVDVPWFGYFGKEVLKDRAVLEKQLGLLRFERVDGKEPDFGPILAYPEFREKYKAKIRVDVGKLIDELKLTADDRVVVQNGGQAMIFVRIREGKAKVVGAFQ